VSRPKSVADVKTTRINHHQVQGKGSISCAKLSQN
jgi:hypothetical protein